MLDNHDNIEVASSQRDLAVIISADLRLSENFARQVANSWKSFNFQNTSSKTATSTKLNAYIWYVVPAIR